MPEIPAAEVHVTRYEVSCLPQDHREHKNFKVMVERHRDGMWSANEGLFGLTADGEWVPDPSRIDHRHTEATALELARAAAPHMTCMGHTVAEALQDREARVVVASGWEPPKAWSPAPKADPPMREDPILSCVRCQDRPAAVGADFCRPCIDEVVGRDEVADRG